MDIKEGDIVEIFDRGRWKKAVLTEHAPYTHRIKIIDGYRYRFNPLPKTDAATGIKPSQGGWVPTTAIRIPINKGTERY